MAGTPQFGEQKAEGWDLTNVFTKFPNIRT